MSAMENDTADFSDGENEKSIVHDRKEKYKTSDQDPETEDSEQEDFDESESEEDESDEYNDDDADHNNVGEDKFRDMGCPKYCPICLKTADLSLCLGCDDMVYCSVDCQQRDWPIHKLLCRKLQPFHAIPRPKKHARAILFPANNVTAGECLIGAAAPRPKFVWFRKWDYKPFFPHGTCEGQTYCEELMGHRRRVSTQNMLILNPSIMKGEPRNSCIEAAVGNRYLMNPYPQPGWRGNLLVVGYKGDVTMRDFRAVVDFFQCYPRNRAIVDPSRYFGDASVGVLTIPEPHLGNPATESTVLEVHMTDAMRFYNNSVALKILDGLLPVYGILEHISQTDKRVSDVINLNEGSLLLKTSVSVNELGKVCLPLEPIPCGTIIYLREDGKPLLKHHYEALSAFVCSEVEQAAGAPGPWDVRTARPGRYKATREELGQRLTKDRFRAFWARFCEGKGFEATLCPLDM